MMAFTYFASYSVCICSTEMTHQCGIVRRETLLTRPRSTCSTTTAQCCCCQEEGRGLVNWYSRILEDKDIARGQQHHCCLTNRYHVVWPCEVERQRSSSVLEQCSTVPSLHILKHHADMFLSMTMYQTVTLTSRDFLPIIRKLICRVVYSLSEKISVCGSNVSVHAVGLITATHYCMEP